MSSKSSVRSGRGKGRGRSSGKSLSAQNNGEAGGFFISFEVVLVIVLSQAGIPEAGLALIFAVDRPLDMCRTVVNITGDATVSMLVDKLIKKK